MSEKWQPQPIEVWQDVSENMGSQVVRDILRSWQYERDMVKYDVFDPTEAEITALRAELERVKRCYASATGKSVCGEGAIMRVECRQMTALRAMVKEMGNVIKTVIDQAAMPYKCQCGEMSTLPDGHGEDCSVTKAQRILNNPLLREIMEAGE